jgi:CRISPR-associated protein Csc2
MGILTKHPDRLLKAYSNYPVGRYVGLVLVRKTESEALFRTEGAGEDLTKEFVRAGVADSSIIPRVVMTKRKQTAVERRTGRELLREHGRLYSKNGSICSLNTGTSCERCIDCKLYGYAVGCGGAQKSPILTEDAYTILSTALVSGKRTGNAPYDDGTMRHPETKVPSQFIYEDPYIRPETHFLEVQTLKDVTFGELVYVLGNILRSTRYGAVSSRQGRMKNRLAAMVFTDCEIFSTLELTQHLYDHLKPEDSDLDFPLRDADVMKATWEATQALLAAVPGLEPVVLGAEEAAQVEQTIGMIYRARERVDRLMALIEQGYSTERQAAQEAHDQVIALLDQFPVELDGREGQNA